MPRRRPTPYCSDCHATQAVARVVVSNAGGYWSEARSCRPCLRKWLDAFLAASAGELGPNIGGADWPWSPSEITVQMLDDRLPPARPFKRPTPHD